MSKAVDEFSKAKQFISHPTVHQKPLHEILENYHQSRLKDEWISITDELPKYDPKHQKAFDILIKASNERYYVGFPVTEYSET